MRSEIKTRVWYRQELWYPKPVKPVRFKFRLGSRNLQYVETASGWKDGKCLHERIFGEGTLMLFTGFYDEVTPINQRSREEWIKRGFKEEELKGIPLYEGDVVKADWHFEEPTLIKDMREFYMSVVEFGLEGDIELIGTYFELQHIAGDL